MFLQHRPTDSLIEILEPDRLFDPMATEVLGKAHAGEEMQDPALYSKAELAFPSGEPLPQCWLNVHYRDIMAYPRPELMVMR